MSFFRSLPPMAAGMVDRIGPAEGAAGVTLTSGTVRRTDRISSAETGGISVQAADTDLLAALHGSLAAGRFLDAVTEAGLSHMPGLWTAPAARRLG